MSNETVLAIDIGGTKLAAAIVDDAGKIREHARVPTPVTHDGEELFAALANMIETLPAAARAEAIACGIGSGGPMRGADRLVSPVNISAWRDFPLRARVQAATGLPTVLENDAKALALGEGWLGA